MSITETDLVILTVATLAFFGPVWGFAMWHALRDRRQRRELHSAE